MINKRIVLLVALVLLASVASTSADDKYYWPPGNNPPGPPPNYNMIDSSYFQGVPEMPEPLDVNVGGYYIYNDTAAGKWYIANHLFTRGVSLEQFHGSILVIMDQPPALNVNFWSQGFELSCNLVQNDRWGWVKWPDSIAENLYEIWWDHTVDYAKPNNIGDYRDTLGVVIAGCAVDFNLWSSGPGHGSQFNEGTVFLGEDMTPLEDVPGFTDTYAGITDQYQVNAPTHDPNTSRFTQVPLPGESYNVNGLIPDDGKCTYNERYSGSWAYEGNGIQFSTLFCPPNNPPNFTTPNATETMTLCFGETIYDTIQVTDPNPTDILTLSILSGPGTLTSTPSTTPVVGYYEFSPGSSGIYTVEFEVTDGNGGSDTLTIVYDVTISTAPIVTLPDDMSLFFCDPAEVCLPVDIIDAECDVTSVTTNSGQYSGTLADYDQVDRINQLGGSITQIGGGAPGTILYTASDFVPPVNSQSGVDVTLPNFMFSDMVVDYGSFPNGLEPGNSADHMLSSPTDLTFTTAGAGGPDGGDGDGSVAFGVGYTCVMGYSQDITSCNGANVDFVVFTNTNGGGTSLLEFRKDGNLVHSITRTLPGGSASSGMGGVTFDLPDGITFNEVEITCQSGSLEIDALAARTAPSPTTEDICFLADTTGVYEITVTATDDCGNIGSDDIFVTVTLNSPPVADAGSDQSFFVCEFDQICLPVSFSDPDDNLDYTELTLGPGALNGGMICFTPTMEGAFTFIIHAVDECSLDDYDTVVVTIDKNEPPVANDPSQVTVFQCEPEELCYAFSAIDPNGGTLTWAHYAGVGAITPEGLFCFTPTISGSYGGSVIVTDSCGAADTSSIVYNVTINSAPVLTDPASPVAVTQCTAEEICFQFQANDTDGGTLVWAQLSGDGNLTAGGLWCFTPVASGTYSAEVSITDSCGLADTTNLSYDVIVNEPPTVAFGEDQAVDLCEPEEICVDYVVSDPQGMANLVEAMISGSGAIDTAANQICFTPSVDGSYEFIVQVTDSCGAIDRDTVVVNVTFGEYASIDCPTGPISVSLCEADSVCQQIDITPASATVSVSDGVYENGELCFYADASGSYVIRIIAQATCSADTCDVTFDVEIGQGAQIDCPDPQSLFLCESQPVCIPVGVVGSGATVTVSPIGTYDAGNVCFLADTSGHYVIEVIAATPCGTDTCEVVADIAMNSNPVAVDPATPVDTFLCNQDQICYQFAANDVDGGTLAWARLSGDGTVTTDGLWCFDANSDGTYSATVTVADECGAADTTSLTYTVEVNQEPVFAFGNDTTVFRCESSQICLPFTLYDANDNLESITLLEGTGVLFTSNNLLCFTPGTEGAHQFIALAIDSCGAAVEDTIVITVDFNAPPVVDAGPDQTLFQCTAMEICWPVSSSDPDDNLESVALITGPGIYNGSTICFTPTGTLDYEFVLQATDECGVQTTDTVVIYYTLNSPPVADAGADETLFLCAPQTICRPASCSDVDANLTGCALISGPGTYDSTDICFNATTSGVYTFILEASDACGETDEDTVVFDVTINSTPVCHVPDDASIFQCVATEVCLPVWADDADGNLDYCQILSGQGTLAGGQWCYTPTASQTVNVTILCVDECGAECQSSFTIQFEINDSPTIAFGTDYSTFLCASTEICLPYTVSDENDPRVRTITLVSGSGTLDEANSQVCFTPMSDGVYTFIIRVEDECGEFDEDTINVTVTINKPPTADVGENQTLFLCNPQTICWPAGCADPDANLTDCIFTGPGLYDGSQVCLDVTTSGQYIFSLLAIDQCNEQSYDEIVIDVTINSAPTVAFGSDFSSHLCEPEEICFPYTVGDADGLSGLVEVMTSGYGDIDTLNNEICFTPTLAGTYEFVVRVTDSCGAYDEDNIVVEVTFGEYAEIDCPTGPIDYSLCAIETICHGITITPTGAVVTTSYGTYSNGELCFLADTSGTYEIRVIATADCGADTCDFVFNVYIGQGAQIDCPAPWTEFLCEAGDICFPVGITGSDMTITVSPIGSYTRGSVCFPADTSGHYVITITAETPCGNDVCEAIVDVTLNSPPVAVDPPVVDMFMCANDQICVQFSASDPDAGQTLTWNRISGAGTVTADGLWCFNVTGSGAYAVTAEVIDDCDATDEITATYNITINSAPVVTCGNDSLVFLCASEEICLSYEVSDIDGNVAVESILPSEYMSGLDTLLNQFCFTPTTPGVYGFTIRATDSCGALHEDTIVVGVQFNSPPLAETGLDVVEFQCVPTEVCIPALCSDVDNNLENCFEATGFATYNGSFMCFMPDTSGVYTLILRAEDECGEFDEDTVQATITLNSDPSCQMPGDESYFQCAPEQVSLPVGGDDPDGNFDHCEIVRGSGSIIGDNWVYTPSTDEAFYVVIMCLDECGASCIDSFHVEFDINAAPVADAGIDQEFFLCNTAQVCWDAGCSDEDDNLTDCEILAPAGATVNDQTGQICLTAQFGDGSDKTYTVILQATDQCGATDIDTVVVEVDFNSPPTIVAPPDFVAYLDAVGELCFSIDIDDPDDNLSSVTVSPIGEYDPVTGQICFEVDTTGYYCLDITATDQCDAQTTETVCIDVQIDACMHVQIEKVHEVIQGQYWDVNIYLNGSGHDLGGFDFLIAYDASALLPSEVLEGDLFTSCGWEYFSYRYGPDGNCGNGCPSGLLRIVGMAESNNGAYHPGCYFDGMLGTLATVQFLVSNDRTYECMFVPISFFWLDCGDNAFSSKDGDTLWVSRDVFDFEYNNITNNTYGFPGYYGVHDSCLQGAFINKPVPIRCVDFTNGGIDIICADSIDARGDINLNGLAYEIADAVMYTNYFVYGLSAFGSTPDGSIAASDVNGDGLPLTVADLVYVIRVIVGDAPPMPKHDPSELVEVVFEISGGVLKIAEAPVTIGAMYIVLEGEAAPKLTDNILGADIQYDFDGTNTRVLIYSMKGRPFATEGSVLTINGPNEIKTIEVGGYNGQVLTAKFSQLPETFSLSQNYPNPFNPITTLEFALPVACEWEVAVYNILGQVVENWSDVSEAGYHTIEWDASRYASGVYLYRLTAGTFSSTRKMVLLK